MKRETIAAIATAVSNSGIGIVRVSGPEAFEITDKIFVRKNVRSLREENGNTIHYGFIQDGNKRLDEVLVMVMKAPHSYTAEDTVEIDCHGGVLIVKKILELVSAMGPEQQNRESLPNGHFKRQNRSVSGRSSYGCDSG